MKPILFSLHKEFERYLNNNVIPGRYHGIYKKWLQYYLDFCHKYDLSPDIQESLPQFIQKLQEKRQTNAQQELEFIEWVEVLATYNNGDIAFLNHYLTVKISPIISRASISML